MHRLAKYMTTRFQSTDAMESGKQNESRLLRWLAKAFPGQVEEVWEAGLVRNKTVPWCVASPDGYANVVVGGVTTLAAVEFKTTSKGFEATTSLTFVEAGTPEYYKYVPTRFRAQLLHQVFVCGLDCSILVIASQATPVASVVVRYSPAQLQSYKEFSLGSPLRPAFSSFVEGCRANKTLEALRAAIPTTNSPHLDLCLRSRVNRAQAFFRFVDALDGPCPPLKYCRPYVQNMYQRLKPWVDQASQGIEQFAGHSTKKPRLNPMLVIEAMKILSYAAMRASRTCVVAEQFADKPLQDGRDAANLVAGPLSVQALNMLTPLLLTENLWLALSGAFAQTIAPQVPIPPPVAAPVPPCRAVLGIDVVKRVVGGEPVLVHGFPVAVALMHQSSTTPLKSSLDPRYEEKISSLANAYDASRVEWKMEANHKRALFVGGTLDGVRLERKLLHAAVELQFTPPLRERSSAASSAPATGSGILATPVQAPQAPAPTPPSTGSSVASSEKGNSRQLHCVVCNKKCQHACVLCGVALCTTTKGGPQPCFHAFHTKDSSELSGANGAAAAPQGPNAFAMALNGDGQLQL
jgi:hypothetical protein